MASTQLSLLGQFPVELHSTVIERLSAQCESAEAFTLAEMVYRRDGTTMLQDDHALRVCAFRSASTEQSKHPAKRTRWSVQVLQKPEPARLSPEVLQRPLIECSIEDGAHPIALASAMGFSQVLHVNLTYDLPTTDTVSMTYSTHAFTLHTRGIVFSRASNSVHIKVYQLFASTSSTEPLDPSHYIIQLYTQFGTTSTSAAGTSAGRGAAAGTTGSGGSGSGSGGLTMQEQKVLATASLKKVQALLKGLVDVGRVE
ncbi:BZ3500_MvSof-1268-A1-R1_Chr3-2g06286 [Microbotryum saponariae]|uniref:BZ3500_MvSof-1268-A1-R1_Chr3-2g06286 protein n=1 Tax=Microbotryum saponariae TaxID=289078 RepID=A0A2X0NGN3_9BASI|nr:BZ3500_MvSof-1268-A1-R1_Chr3-2g06286 [Microbotryum saponariae]SDA04257.1 BZ3501_MvSof-1269-A2-R1_Chr3-2g05977 [Microbotryum saponariae]